MEYKRDLLTEVKKSKLRVIFGILFFVFSIAWIMIRFIENEPIRTFDWIYSIVFSLNGITHISSGLGYSPERLIGKAFIQIDGERIKIKLGVFDKEFYINWQDISAIAYKPNVFKIKKRDNTTQVISISKLDFIRTSEIKDVIANISNEKGIEYSIV